MEETNSERVVMNVEDVVKFFNKTPEREIRSAEFDSKPTIKGCDRVCISVVKEDNEVYILPLEESKTPEEITMGIEEFKEGYKNFSFTLDNFYQV